MKRIEYRFEKELPPGPWDGEPDKVQWPDAATGLACMIRRGPTGAWCGYVGVDESHPLHGRGYSGVDVEVHGGLTYAAACDGDETGICHVVDPGDPDPAWWFGFDCGHAFDLVPLMPVPGDPGVYRDQAYVTAEVQRLALQIAGSGW